MGRRTRGSRRTTQWVGIGVTAGATSTTAITRELLDEATMDVIAPCTIVRIRGFMMVRSALAAGENSTNMVMAIRKVTLTRSTDSIVAVGGTLIDPAYLDNEDILGMYGAGFTGMSSGTEKQRGVLTWDIDIKAKRKMESSNDRLVLDHEAVGVAVSATFELVMRILVMLH